MVVKSVDLQMGKKIDSGEGRYQLRSKDNMKTGGSKRVKKDANGKGRGRLNQTVMDRKRCKDASISLDAGIAKLMDGTSLGQESNESRESI